MTSTTGSKTVVPAKAGKPAKKQAYTALYVPRSDGVPWTQQQIMDDMIATAAKENTDISEPLEDDEERMRAWMIKLGKFVKFNLGTNKQDSKHAAPWT
jgi:hypothetical protein